MNDGGKRAHVLIVLGMTAACTPSPHPSPPAGPPPRQADSEKPDRKPSYPFSRHPGPCFWEATDPKQMTDTLEDRVAKLAAVSDMPYICDDFCEGGDGCGDASFWTVVRDGLDALPLLVDRLDDASPTTAALPNFGGEYAVGDVALDAISEIVRGIPTFDLVNVKFDDSEEGCGGCAWWNFVRASPANRQRVEKAVGKWLSEAKPRLQWQRSDEFGTLDCVRACVHPAGGHYALP